MWPGLRWRSDMPPGAPIWATSGSSWNASIIRASNAWRGPPESRTPALPIPGMSPTDARSAGTAVAGRSLLRLDTCEASAARREGGIGGGALQAGAIETEHALRGLDLQAAVAHQRVIEILGGNPAVGGLEQQDRLGRGRGEAGDLGEYERDLVARVEQHALDHVDVDTGEKRQRDHRFLELTRAGEAVDIGLAETTGAAERLDRGAGGGRSGGDLAGLALDAADDLAEHAFQRFPGGGIFGREPGADSGRGLFEQPQEMLPRQVGPDADVHRQRLVARGAFHQHAEAGVGEARARVLHHRANHVLVSARHQHIGDRLAQ